MNDFAGKTFFLLVGAIVGYWLKIARENWESRKTRSQRFAVLRAEINYCAKLARTYITEPYMAPLYRFPRTVFDATYPHLASQSLSESDVYALTGFYSQVDQMNRGLDAVERYRAAGDEEHMVREVQRLMKKAEEMAQAEGIRQQDHLFGFYNAAIDAVDRHLQ
jgi:hypothetical protein